MPKKELLLFSAVILVGVLDWLTTVTGVLFFGAVEVNPLLSGLTRSSILLFSTAKIAAVVLAGLAFYKAFALIKPSKSDWRLTNGFLNGGCLFTVLVLSVVVVNNMVAVIGL